MPTVADLLRRGSNLPGESARRDTEILLCHALDKPRTWLYTWPESDVDAPRVEAFDALLAQRTQGRPVAHLTGRREFWSLNLRVNEHTLIPRPETETLVEWALALSLPAEADVLDLGTGSGAIALALASERPNWQMSAVDASPEALEVARTNAAEAGLGRVQFCHSDWFGEMAGRRFHLLVSNPPYVEEGDVHLSTGDLRFEPQKALMARQQGMSDLMELVRGAPDHLHPKGWLLLEHGHDQGEKVRALLAERGFSHIETSRDLAGLERISGGQWHV
ncbi:MAG: peptide chain release factor N(5)-glutamine methyltransferase [Proteobacteria bacterium]|nr:peptide chain release factor N(5)-glutamine methyltransferase [Pseudomonadota bacterium]